MEVESQQIVLSVRCGPVADIYTSPLRYPLFVSYHPTIDVRGGRN
jgi:hypothetical protein